MAIDKAYFLYKSTCEVLMYVFMYKQKSTPGIIRHDFGGSDSISRKKVRCELAPSLILDLELVGTVSQRPCGH